MQRNGKPHTQFAGGRAAVPSLPTRITPFLLPPSTQRYVTYVPVSSNTRYRSTFHNSRVHRVSSPLQACNYRIYFPRHHPLQYMNPYRTPLLSSILNFETHKISEDADSLTLTIPKFPQAAAAHRNLRSLLNPLSPMAGYPPNPGSGYPYGGAGGYGAPPPPYGSSPAPSAPPYGAKPPKEGKTSSSSAPYYGGGGGYGAPPSTQPYGSGGGYGAPPSSQPYGAPYGAPPPSSAPYGAPGGYGSPFASLVPSAFPPGTDPNVVACFQAADRDGSGMIDDKELQSALSGYSQSFSLRTVHLLMYLFTNTNVRKIGPKEFTSVFYSLQNWRSIFERFDRDRSGKIDATELRDALLSLGYSVSPTVLDLLVSKFDKTGGKNKAIEYDNFIE
ncbi:hypothetical protein DAI22_12g029000 [Oryza sativa Japonica Group]|nr:hypothetical protein DAI22_12g029000 [Oryza sativa Japonica Group]